MPEASIKSNLKTLQHRIDSACLLARRDPAGILLLAVSKTKPVEMVNAALSCGQHHFGENYPQDAMVKIRAVTDERAVWHFIGAIQSNKTRSIAENFDWVHTVASEKIARRLNDQRPATREPLNVLLQVNIDKEESKAGLTAEQTRAIIRPLMAFENIRLRGLMTIPAPSQQPEIQQQAFRRLEQLRQLIASEFDLHDFDQLSMGMSADLEAAVAEGTTVLRIGTAIFGART